MKVICKKLYALATAAALVLPAASPERLAATTFISLSQDQLAEIADAAVIGAVAEITSGRDPLDGEIRTDIRIAVEDVLFGAIDAEEVLLREAGGRVGDSEEWIYGAASYRVGERVLAFLSEGDDGTYRTTAMAMGKFAVHDRADGSLELLRDFGEGVQVLGPDGELIADPAPEVVPLSDTVRRSCRERRCRQDRRGVPAPLAEPLLTEETRAEFTYLGSSPARWFEPDWGETVLFKVDHTGDPGPELGPAESVGAVHDAFDSWSSVTGSAFRIAEEGPLPEVLPFSGCSGGNRIVFNDPFNEITDPNLCGGVLAVGGFCTSGETVVVNGTQFRRIRVGKVTFNNGWSSCRGWNRCNMSEVATHEIGHAIGLGHSPELDAMMRSFAYFNGRCTTLGSDDENAMRFIYPPGAQVATATPTPTTLPDTPTRTPTTRPTDTPTQRPTDAATPRPTGTWTPVTTRTWTATPTRTFTPPRTRTSTATPPPTAVVHRVSGRVRYFAGGGAVPGAEVRLDGSVSRLRQTSTDGFFDFGMIDAGNYVELRAGKLGDVGAARSSLDAAYALQSVVGSRSLSDLQRLACDATGDGTISPLDASRLLQVALGAIPELPVVEHCGGDWMMVPSQESGGVRVPPIVSADACTPGALVVPTLTVDATSLLFDAVLLGDCSGGWTSSEGALRRDRPRGRVRLGRLRRRDGRVETRVYVRSREPFQSLDLDLRFDATQLAPASVESRDLDAQMLLAQRQIEPGLLRIAFAVSEAIPRRHGALLTITFDVVSAARPRLGRLLVERALLDERPVRAR